ncbi:MAG TPA: metallophosphoesterase family protein [Candidatus Krumholzibacteria bacterium]|nr:metallophosphoesterase family protein [Candidatus Krumholzibacteria bacterium]HRX52165.1 metallophosphoesterase family protein [Candidatus Krumholzibacteria bacterium]
MITAVFSDVHANLHALVAVLTDARAHGAERFVCLGDVVGYNADPVACVDLLRGLPRLVCLQGNHDAMAAGLEPLTGIHPHAAASLLWTRDRLDAERREWLASRPLIFDDDLATYVHARLPDPAAWAYLQSAGDAAAHLDAQTAPVSFVGHAHEVFGWRMSGDGPPTPDPGLRWRVGQDRLVVGVGSVGQPRDRDPRAAYALLRHADRLVEVRRVAYDVTGAQTAIRAAGLPGAIAARLER